MIELRNTYTNCGSKKCNQYCYRNVMGSMVFDVLESEIFPQGIPILVSIFLFLRQYPSSNARMLKVIYFKCGIIYILNHYCIPHLEESDSYNSE